MHFKLSVRELEILDKDRIKILKKLRERHLRDSSVKSSDWAVKKPMKPPILVAPLELDGPRFKIYSINYDSP